MVSKLKSRRIYLAIYTLVSLKALEYEFDNVILIFYKLNLFLGKLIPNLKLLQLYLKIWLKTFEWIQIWHVYFTIFYWKSKYGQIGPKYKISLDLLENLCMS